MQRQFGTEEAIRRWNGFAKAYATRQTEWGDLYREVLLNPVLFSLLGNVEHKNVLDAGCGEGYLSRLLARSGANVTAVDYAGRMIEIAGERTPQNLGINYHRANCEDLSLFEDNCFDVIVSNMVIQDLADYERAFHEMYRLLTVGGLFIFSILHPCFVTPDSGWEKTDSGEKLHWNTDNYFYEGVYEQPFGEEENMLLFHRTLTSYINALLKTGFQLEAIEEPKPSADMLQKHRAFSDNFRYSNFIVFKLKK
ncbi:class I SAM-dependent methyltransferase [Alkalihalobacillus oceani]|uniref:class I SAM-dependent methyltransferase n=1 Tax=Halalkalibacter oceani TaxID=1653776 RepID=UPI00203A5FDE|nr:class I SAM-dependent methyltransferase [Halalkalibacter oceani]MCM3761412.1 class I SAM-dependent methyltransferase [Halalkalibacter oceani]